MNRKVLTLIGIVLVTLGAVMLLMAGVADGDHLNPRPFLVLRLTAGLLAAFLGLACVVPWGRPYTMRVALGLLALAMLGMIGHIMMSDNPEIWPSLSALMIAVMSGTYAVTGYYPDFLPYAEVFGNKPFKPFWWTSRHQQARSSPPSPFADYPQEPSDPVSQPPSFKEPAPAENQVESSRHDPLSDDADDAFRPAPFKNSPALTSGHDTSAEDPLSSIVLRQPNKSMLVSILLLSLIPYGLATSGFIAYLLYQQRVMNQFDPLVRLDPKAKEGGAREQVQHDLPLPQRLQTAMRQPLRVGALEVTPMEIKRTAKDELVLLLDMHNVSGDQEFSPVHEDFARSRQGFSTYIYLEPKGAAKVQRLYGGDFDWPNGDKDKLLAPGQHMLIQLSTGDNAEDQKLVRSFLKQPQEMVWRVHVRRGLMAAASGMKSATAVIGVQFNTAAVEQKKL